MSPIVALTGGTGFIGQALWKGLEQAGWRVRVLIRPDTYKRSPNSFQGGVVQGMLEDEDSLRSLIQGADAIIHCAGLVQGNDPSKFHRVNVEAVSRLATLAAGMTPSPRFVLISSLAARNPELSLYAKSKRDGENALATSAGKMPWVAFRPPAVYGPGDRHLRPLFQWIRRGVGIQLGPKDARFSMLFVEDLVKAVVLWLDRGEPNGRFCELDDGHAGGYSWQDVCNIVAQGPTIPLYVPAGILQALAKINERLGAVFHYEPMLTMGKVRELRYPNWVCDNSELDRTLGWKPSVSLKDGVAQVLNPGGQIVSTRL